MGERNNVIFRQEFENRKRYAEREQKIAEIKKQVNENYKSEILDYTNHCELTSQEEDEISYVDYLYVSLINRVKKSTWEKRVVAIRRYLIANHEVSFSDESKDQVSHLRKMYNLDEYASLKSIKGKSFVDKDELLESIHKLPVREKAICLVNLVTANRPNEMVRLKISDFDLEGRNVIVNLKKQNKLHNKRLTIEVVKAVREYVAAYKLTDEDYFIGRTYSNGRYESKQISETAYRKQLKKWTGLTPYNFRKTQVSAMHLEGADLSTIAKQTGHKSVNTLEKHYLAVSDSTIDKYL